MKLFKRNYRIVYEERTIFNPLKGTTITEDVGYYIELKDFWTILFFLFSSHGVWERLNIFPYATEEEAKKSLENRLDDVVTKVKKTTKETFRITI